MSITTSEMSAADLAAVVGNDKNNNGLFGGDGLYAVIVLFLIIAMMGGGFGFGGFGGFGGNAFGAGMMEGGWGLYPWMNQAEITQSGFANQATNSAIQALQNSVTSGFGDVQLGIAGVNQNICQTGNGIVNAINGGFANAETAANARQIANMQQDFAAQTAITGGIANISAQIANASSASQLATCQTNNTIVSEGNATRFADANNTRDIIDSQTRGTQAILDKLCQLELDGVKAQVDAKNDRIAELTNQLSFANLAASQTAQTATILQGQNQEVDALYNRLKSCPVPSQPVYGSQPIFTCNGGCNGVAGCGCNGNF